MQPLQIVLRLAHRGHYNNSHISILYYTVFIPYCTILYYTIFPDPFHLHSRNPVDICISSCWAHVPRKPRTCNITQLDVHISPINASWLKAVLTWGNHHQTWYTKKKHRSRLTRLKLIEIGRQGSLKQSIENFWKPQSTQTLWNYSAFWRMSWKLFAHH